MGSIANCRSLVPLVAFFIVVSFPVRSAYTEELLASQGEEEAEGCEDVLLKRFDDIDYDTFVSLMGRRGAPEPSDGQNRQFLRRQRCLSSKGDIDPILAGLLGQGPRMAPPCPQRRGGFINHRRCKRFL